MSTHLSRYKTKNILRRTVCILFPVYNIYLSKGNPGWAEILRVWHQFPAFAPLYARFWASKSGHQPYPVLGGRVAMCLAKVAFLRLGVRGPACGRFGILLEPMLRVLV